MTLDPMHTSQQPAEAVEEQPEWNARALIAAGRASSRKRTRTLADRADAAIQRLAEVVNAEQRIAQLEDQIRTERGKLTGTGTDADDGLDDA